MVCACSTCAWFVWVGRCDTHGARLRHACVGAQVSVIAVVVSRLGLLNPRDWFEDWLDLLSVQARSMQ